MLQVNPNTAGRTIVMEAAFYGQYDTVRGLVEEGAGVNMLNTLGWPALYYAILSGDTQTVEYLAERTTAGLSASLVKLAESNIEITPVMESFVEMCREHREARVAGMKKAAEFGNTALLKILLTGVVEIEKADLDAMIGLAIQSDSPAVCEAVLGQCEEQGHRVGQDYLTMVGERGDARIRKIFDRDFEEQADMKKEKLKAAIEDKTADIFDLVPKSEEFSYTEEVQKVVNLIGPDDKICFDKLITAIHIPPVHYDKDCPGDCAIQEQCQHFREVVKLVEHIKNKLGERHPIFKGMNQTVVGSMKEQTRIMNLDEVDITLGLDDKVGKMFKFDEETQTVILDKENMPEEVDAEHFAPYIHADNTLDGSKFFKDFVHGVYTILNEAPWENSSTMKTMSTSFTPCTKCMNREKVKIVCRRCRHKPGCPHDDDVFTGCRIFLSPCLSRSKIGVVLHLAFIMFDGSIHYIDCDINCPVMSPSTTYDGSVNAVQTYLVINKPVGWVEEYRKLESMTAVSDWPGVSSGVRFRNISQGVVLASQVRIQCNTQYYMQT